ncbi:Allergen Bla g 4 [Blattella germanica]|nr:Allergen Bla g 4 [Blattella germanica]
MCSVSVVLFTVLALCLSSSLVNAECNPGESQLTDFDYKKFTGNWHILSSNSEEFSKYCWDDDYEEGPDGTVLNSDYTCPNGSRIQETVKVDLQGSKFDLEYPDHTAGFTASYAVLATDYEHFAIIGGCPPDIINGSDERKFIYSTEIRMIVKQRKMKWERF